MNLDQLTAFTAAMQHKNLEAMLSHMADDARSQHAAHCRANQRQGGDPADRRTAARCG
jgi:hypothetical protein